MAFTIVTSALLRNSQIEGTPIGQVTPSTARFVTPASSDNSQNAATTAWALLGFTFNFSQNGFLKFPSWLAGFIIQWGYVNVDLNGGTRTINFPTAFPTTPFVVVPTTVSSTDRITYVVNGSLNNSSFTIGNNGSNGFAYWIAVGH